METAELHRRTVAAWRELLASIPDSAWNDPTPCTEWCVRDLVNHVTYEELWTVPLLEGKTIEEVGDRFDGDVLGADPVTAAKTAAGHADDAVDMLLTQACKVHLSYGEESGEEYVLQLATDHLVHGWDLAAALGVDRTLDPELVAEVAAWFAEREEGYRKAGAIGPRLASDGSPQADLLAAFGRSAEWAPPS